MHKGLSGRTRKIVVNGMVCLAAMLFVAAFFVGRQIEREQEEARNNAQPREEGTHQYSGIAVDAPAEPGRVEGHEDYEYDDPAVDQVEAVDAEHPPGLEELFPLEEVEDSKEAAASFVREFYQYDGGDPLSHVQRARPFMTEDLYRRYASHPARPTHEVYRKELVALEMSEPYEPSGEYIAWDGLVTGRVFDTEGNSREEEAWFLVRMEKAAGGYRVSAVALNKPH